MEKLGLEDLDMNTEVIRSFWDTPAPKGSNTGANGVSTRPSDPLITPKVQTVAFVHSTMRASSRQPVVTLSPGRSDALPTLNVFPEDQDAQRYSFDVMSDTPSDGQVAATILAVPLQTLQPDESVAMSNSSLICLGANGGTEWMLGASSKSSPANSSAKASPGFLQTVASNIISQVAKQKDSILHVAAFKIYNDQLVDILSAPEKKHSIFQNSDGEIIIESLTQIPIAHIKDFHAKVFKPCLKAVKPQQGRAPSVNLFVKFIVKHSGFFHLDDDISRSRVSSSNTTSNFLSVNDESVGLGSFVDISPTVNRFPVNKHKSATTPNDMWTTRGYSLVQHRSLSNKKGTDTHISVLEVVLLAPYEPSNNTFISREQQAIKRSLLNLSLMLDVCTGGGGRVGLHWRSSTLTHLLERAFTDPTTHLTLICHANPLKSALPITLWSLQLLHTASKLNGKYTPMIYEHAPNTNASAKSNTAQNGSSPSSSSPSSSSSSSSGSSPYFTPARQHKQERRHSGQLASLQENGSNTTAAVVPSEGGKEAILKKLKEQMRERMAKQNTTEGEENFAGGHKKEKEKDDNYPNGIQHKSNNKTEEETEVVVKRQENEVMLSKIKGENGVQRVKAEKGKEKEKEMEDSERDLLARIERVASPVVAAGPVLHHEASAASHKSDKPRELLEEIARHKERERQLEEALRRERVKTSQAQEILHAKDEEIELLKAEISRLAQDTNRQLTAIKEQAASHVQMLTEKLEKQQATVSRQNESLKELNQRIAGLVEHQREEDQSSIIKQLQQLIKAQTSELISLHQQLAIFHSAYEDS